MPQRAPTPIAGASTAEVGSTFNLFDICCVAFHSTARVLSIVSYYLISRARLTFKSLGTDLLLHPIQ